MFLSDTIQAVDDSVLWDVVESVVVSEFPTVVEAVRSTTQFSITTYFCSFLQFLLLKILTSNKYSYF